MPSPELHGPWNGDQVRAFLDETTTPIRVAYAGTSGELRIVPLWWHFDEGTFWLATQSDAAVAKAISKDPRVAFDVSPNEPPYCGVRGSGRAELVPGRGAETLERLIQRFLGDSNAELARWLRSRSENETAIAIAPESLTTWDYGNRMEGTPE